MEFNIMKIAMVGQFPPHVGGVGVHIHTLAKQLVKQNHEVYVITYPHKDIKDIDGIHVIGTTGLDVPGIRGLMFRRNAKKALNDLVEKEDIDIIHGHYLYPAGAAAVDVGKKHNIKTYVTAHGSDMFELYKSHPLIRPIIKKVIKNADGVFAVSNALKQEIIKTGIEGISDKVKLIETSGHVYTSYYTLGDTVDYYYGPLVPSAGYLKVWGLERLYDGLLLRVPDKNDPTQLSPKVDQPRTFEMFAEKTRWDIIMRLSNAGDVNKAILRGYASELIQVSEALQEKKIVKIAEEIDRRFHQPENPIRLVLITGPSSSGKSTFCKRLSVQLLACGLRPYSFSTDDYFVNRVDTPKLPNGQYDFDNIETVDYKLLGEHLERLMKGEVVEVPEYNFVTGKREWNGKKFKLNNDSVLIIEGIHALNPLLTKQIPDSSKYRIYISALTSISLDDHNWIPTQDNRLLRRIIRDYNKGAFSARETISQWKSVCEAEDQWIFPFQETADVMFNSALNIEFAVLRTHAELILSSVPKNCAEYAEAHRLLKFLRYFIPISDKEIPPTSIMREFVGGSSFKY